jgi:tetratricopeptide (TPR) repeat protein
MIKRRRLRPGAVLPFDREVLLHLPLRYQHANIILQQGKILKRRASNLGTIAIEWPWFAMDNKTERLLSAPRELEAIKARLEEHHGGTPGAGPYSFCALLEARMGRIDTALEMNTRALAEARGDPMVLKRQAEILMMSGDHGAALQALSACRAVAPDHAFWHFLEGLIHESAGDMDRALPCFEAAAAMDDSTAELHGYLSDIYRDAGNTEAAIAALEKASRIAPNQQRYENRRNRLEKKSA